MLRRIVSIGSVFSVSAVLGLASGAGAQTPTQDSVNGAGHALTSDNQGVDFTITASSGPSGENPTGHVAFIQGRFGTNFEGPVRCLAVNGNVATLNVDTGLSFGIVTVEVTDSPSGDLIRAFPTARSPGDCSPLGTAVDFRVDSGDIVVVDAPALPTSRDQCKNSGWKAFGVFKNQGQCVSFVATGGKKPPGGG